MNITEAITELDTRKKSIINIKHLILKLNDKYGSYSNFNINTYKISFRATLSNKELEITNKLLNKPNYLLMVNIGLEEEYRTSQISYSIILGNKNFPVDYSISYDVPVIRFRMNERPKKLINAIDYFISEMQNYVSNINISKDKYIEIFNAISDAQTAYTKNTINKYKLEFKKYVADKFDIVTNDNLKDFVDYITNIKVNKNNILQFLKVILFNNLHKITEEKFNLKG
jgi:hypothetical protein